MHTTTTANATGTGTRPVWLVSALTATAAAAAEFYGLAARTAGAMMTPAMALQAWSCSSDPHHRGCCGLGLGRHRDDRHRLHGRHGPGAVGAERR